MSLRLQAEAGDPRAQTMLAAALLVGRDAPAAPEEALRLVRAACEKNYTEALLFHAALTVIGLGRPQSFAEAHDMVARAAALGSGRAKGQLAALGGGKGFNEDVWRAYPEITERFAEPRIYTIKNFIPREACAWIMSQCRKQLVDAPVWDYATASLIVDPARTASGTAFSIIAADMVVHLISLRISALIGMPIAHQEPTNVIHYNVGEEYKPHYDFFSKDEELQAFAKEIRQIGQRIGTCLIYLNDGYEGGETEFPLLDWRFKGQTGDALFFWSEAATGEMDLNALHAGLPIRKGQKWLLSKWIRAHPIPMSRYPTPFNLR